MKAFALAHLQPQLAAIPHQPGIYQFRDSRDRLLYVGKAKDLAKRVGSYFVRPQALEPAKQIMVQRIAAVDYVVVASEQEALLLEANLIHRKQPPFNIVLRDDRSFLYIQLTFDPPQVRATRFPGGTVRHPRARDSFIYGPYASGEAVYQTLRALKAALVGPQFLPGLFVAPRRGQLLPPLAVTPTSFDAAARRQAQEIVAEVAQFLAGHTAPVVQKLKKQLVRAAVDRQYELAAERRDQLAAIQSLLERQEVITAAGAHWDVTSLFREGTRSAINVFKVRGGKLIDRVATVVEHAAAASDAYILQGFLLQYYQVTDERPKLVILPAPIETRVVSDQLRQPLPPVAVPRRGIKLSLLAKGRQNAEHFLRTQTLRHVPQWDGPAASRQLALALRLEPPLARIELIDISHIQGRYAVGALVVALGGVPDPSCYRRFRIKLARGGDDFAAIREVVSRRVRHGEWPTPDILIIDGGAVQLNAARLALAGTRLAGVPTAAIAKREELIYLNPREAPLRLPRASAALRLVQRLRDEAHRFAVTYHRNLRSAEIPRGRNI